MNSKDHIIPVTLNQEEYNNVLVIRDELIRLKGINLPLNVLLKFLIIIECDILKNIMEGLT